MKKSLSKFFTMFFIVLLMLLGIAIPNASQDTFALPYSGVDSIAMAYRDNQIQRVPVFTKETQNNESGEDENIEDLYVPLFDDPFRQGPHTSLQWWWTPVLLTLLVGNSAFFGFLLLTGSDQDDEDEKKESRGTL